MAGSADTIKNAISKHLAELSHYTILTYQLIASVVITFVIILFSNNGITSAIIPSSTSFFNITFYAVLIIILNKLMVFGFINYELNLGTILISSELVFCVITGFLLLNETPVLKEIIGGLLIIVSIIAGNINVLQLKGNNSGVLAFFNKLINKFFHKRESLES